MVPHHQEHNSEPEQVPPQEAKIGVTVIRIGDANVSEEREVRGPWDDVVLVVCFLAAHLEVEIGDYLE